MDAPDSELMHPAHRQVWELLPWYENGTLDAHERRLVESHLGECLVCSREVRKLGSLTAAVAVPAEDHACTQAFRRLSAQIRSSRTGAPGWTGRLVLGLRNLFEPAPLLAGASVLVVSSLLVAVIVMNGRTALTDLDQAFETLGQQKPEAAVTRRPVLRVVLREAAGDAGLDAWLERHRAELVDGPSSIGVLTVEVVTESRNFDAVISAIRADDETLFVEPVHVLGIRPDRLR